MNTCKTCVWWGEPGEQREDVARSRECSKTLESDLMVAIFGYSDAHLVTDSRFGCVEHEEIPAPGSAVYRGEGKR